MKLIKCVHDYDLIPSYFDLYVLIGKNKWSYVVIAKTERFVSKTIYKSCKYHDNRDN